jgi:hypothetical protein
MMSELSATQRRDLMEIVDDRHDRGSIILATQIPLSSWHGAIGDATYADAILDRIVHVAYRLELQGDSLRKPSRGVTASSGSAIDQPASHAKETTLTPIPFSSVLHKILIQRCWTRSRFC